MPFTDDEILERLKNYLSIEGDWSLQDNKFKSPVFNTANDAQQAADRMDAPFLWGYRPPLIEQNADEPGFRIVLPGDLARNFFNPRDEDRGLNRNFNYLANAERQREDVEQNPPAANPERDQNVEPPTPRGPRNR